MPVAAVRPKWAVFVYLGVLFWFSSPVWGVAEGVEVFDIYSKGTGLLPVSLLNVFLIGLFFLSLVSLPRGIGSDTFSLRKYFLAFALLFLGYFIVGLISRVPVRDILAWTGVINVVNMGLLAVIARRAFTTEEDIRHLSMFIVLSALLRGTWGIVRLIVLGGDPANYYANYEQIDVRITFFDINDNLVAVIGAFLAGWQFNWNRRSLQAREKAICLATIAVALVVIVFSYRRSAWIGLVLAGFLFVWMQPTHRRVPALAILGSVSTFVFGIVAFWRFRFGAGGESAIRTIFADIFGGSERTGVEYGRFSELILAFRTIMEHPVFGIGPWGQFVGGFRDFLHSGFLHVWLKTGSVGLTIFVAIFTAFFVFVYQQRGRISEDRRALFETGVAGMFFMVPTLLFGTPVIEYRTMQMLGLLLAMPYIVHAVEMKRKSPDRNGGKVGTPSSTAAVGGPTGHPTGLGIDFPTRRSATHAR